jgi:hypothetical protein
MTISGQNPLATSQASVNSSSDFFPANSWE